MTARLLRAIAALLLLTLLTTGVPVLLALTIGNPLDGWEALTAGDVSATVWLDLLALTTWAAWACFLWALVREITALATGIPYPHLTPPRPGPQYLAHTLITAVLVLLPSTAALAGPSTPATVSLHLSLTASDSAPSGSRTVNHPPPGGAAPGMVSTSTHAEGRHTATEPPSTGHRNGSPLLPSQVAIGTGVGLLTGATLRELTRLARRQWRFRRPGRAIAALPPDLAALAKTLTRVDSPPVSDLQRTQVLAAYASTEDQAMGPARGHAPWDALSDAAGAPLPQLPSAGDRHSEAATPTAPAETKTGEQGHHPHEHRSAVSVLEAPLDTLLTTAATTVRDVHTLAPPITPRLRALVDQADPGLDTDLAEWRDPDTVRPRLSLLGPPQVRAAGALPSPRPRLPWHTEVLTYLAAHPHGVTPETFGAALWPDDPDIASKPKLRQAIFVVRHWLDTNPTTGQAYLPQLKTDAGSALYRVDGLLTDADLFRRLRLRGVTRGPHGIHDLETALALVTGPPLDPTQRRSSGYGWLIDTPIDTEYTAMIVDVAHLVATYHLSTGRPVLAAHAARVALTAGSQDDIPLLDLVAACDAQGHRAEAATWIQRILTVYDTDIEEDLPPRTAEILHRRRWHQAT